MIEAGLYWDINGASVHSRLRALQVINISLLFTYLVALGFNYQPASAFSQSCLVVLVTYLLIHLVEALLLSKYGREISVEEFSRPR